MSRAAVVALVVAILSCAPPAPTGQSVMPATMSDEIKTVAVRNALSELARATGGSEVRRGVYLDSAVGPTPAEYMYRQWHSQEWLASIVEAGLVDGTFGLPRSRSGLRQLSYTIDIGEPYPAGKDTVQIVYSWCARPFPATPGAVAPGGVWRDAMLQSDTGWVRVTHSPTTVVGSCVQ